MKKDKNIKKQKINVIEIQKYKEAKNKRDRDRYNKMTDEEKKTSKKI